jgi:formiminoglutamase
MSLQDFLQPIELDFPEEEYGVDMLHEVIQVHTSKSFPDLAGCQIAIFGVDEDRNAPQNQGCIHGADVIREYLYKLANFDIPPVIADLGNVKAGATISDTYAAVKTISGELISQNCLPILIGGSQDLTFGTYMAYEALEQTVNVVTVDARLDFGASPEETLSTNYLNKVLLHSPNYLFNYSNIGHQRYLVGKDLIELMEKMYFDLHRLGVVAGDIQIIEPVVRNADIVSFDISAIRASDAPGSGMAGPNGLYGDQACQIARYAGMSDKLSAFGIYEYNPGMDPTGITAHLIAQMIWCFVEGFQLRKKDYPIGNKDDYIKYMVDLSKHGHQLVFYKSPRSDRWWMDVPYPAGSKNKYERHHLVPCTYADYQCATNEEMPDRWWRTYQKLT